MSRALAKIYSLLASLSCRIPRDFTHHYLIAQRSLKRVTRTSFGGYAVVIPPLQPLPPLLSPPSLLSPLRPLCLLRTARRLTCCVRSFLPLFVYLSHSFSLPSLCRFYSRAARSPSAAIFYLVPAAPDFLSSYPLLSYS